MIASSDWPVVVLWLGSLAFLALVFWIMARGR